MVVKSGEDRIALVGESLTLKIAKSNPIKLGKELLSLVHRGGIRGLLSVWGYESQNISNRLLHGVLANRRESRVAKKYGEVVIPTICLLGGIANLQRTAVAPSVDSKVIEDSFIDHLGYDAVRLGHTIESPDNFGLTASRVKLVDGGGRILETLLESRRPDIVASLDSITSQLPPRRP